MFGAKIPHGILKWGGFLAFAILLITNLSQHPLWADELQAWGLAQSSSSPVDIFWRIQSEGHPMLWYLVLWPFTRFTHNPVAMQILHALISLGWLALIWFRSPFTIPQKVLLCFSYPLVYDYALYARSYGLGIFLLFTFASAEVVWTSRPRLGWLWLGLLANTHFFFALSSLALATVWVAGSRAPKLLLKKGAIYPTALVFSALSMARSFQRGQSWHFTFTRESLATKVAAFGSAFCPIGDPGQAFFDAHLPKPDGLWLAALVVLAFCFYLKRQPVALASMLGLTVATVAFFYLVLGGHSWHAETLFIFFLGLVWLLQARGAKLGPPAILWLVLACNGAAGILTVLGSPLVPLSRTQATAAWIRGCKLENECWIAFPAFPTVTMAACLNQPFYCPETDSKSTYVEWALISMQKADFAPRVARTVKLQGTAYLVVEGSLTEELRSDLGRYMKITQVADFRQAVLENYFVYQLEIPTTTVEK
ncbi:hypothetical protein IV102_14300 [bacterium]|nr:hypothetical protein [bacterium]